MRFLENSWIFPVIEAIHVVAMAMLAGSIVLVNLQALGWLPAGLLNVAVAGANDIEVPTDEERGDEAKKQEPAGNPFNSLDARLTPWIRTGAVTIAATGMIMLVADATRYFVNPAFLLKIVLLIAILATRNITGRRGAMLSLALWTLIVLASRAVIDFDIPPLYRPPLPLPL